MSKIQHMVLFQFKSGTSEAIISGLFDELAGLKSLCPGILHFAGGKYASPERMNGDYTHGFLMTFDSSKNRDIYLPHPEHERVKALILPHLENVIAFDCEDNS
ncbi:MAG: stress responsive protein [Planctomycetaceae bacterium]|nr:stress responsive protein [Planctomycetaceae bacterium]